MSQDLIFRAYLPESANQVGGDLPYFVGRQYGSGWLGTLAKVAFPILKRIAGVASRAAEDVIYNDKPVKSAFVDHAVGAINDLVQQPTSSSSINRRNVPRKRKSTNYPLFQKRARK